MRIVGFTDTELLPSPAMLILLSAFFASQQINKENQTVSFLIIPINFLHKLPPKLINVPSYITDFIRIVNFSPTPK